MMTRAYCIYSSKDITFRSEMNQKGNKKRIQHTFQASVK